MEKSRTIRTKKSAFVRFFFIVTVLIIYTLYVYYSMKKRLKIKLNNETYSDAAFCVSDLLETGFKMSRIILILILVVVLIAVLKPYFRNIVMLQYQNRGMILWHMYKYCVKTALLFSFAASMICTALAMILSDSFANNWHTKGSFMYTYCGTPLTSYILPTWKSILIFGLGVFLLLLVVGFTVILSWYLLNPVMAMILILVLYGLETTTNPPFLKLLFAYINIDNVKIFFYGLDYMSFFVCPLLWCIAVVTTNILLIKKKNLFY